MVGLSVWARWAALDYTTIAVVLALEPALHPGRPAALAARSWAAHVERVTPQIWLGAALVVVGGLVLRALVVTVVDAHAHVIVPEASGPRCAGTTAARWSSSAARPIRAAVREFVDLGQDPRRAGRAGVDRIVLCPWVNLSAGRPPRQNEGLAAMVRPPRRRARHGRPRNAPEELVELMGDGRLSGVEVAASVDGVYLGHDRFADFWAAAAEAPARSSSSTRRRAASASRR